MSETKKKKFNIFDSQREGKGVEKGEVRELNFKNFFKYFARSFTKLLSVNLMFTFFCLPLFFALFAIAGFFDSTVPTSTFAVASPLQGLLACGEFTPTTMSLYGVYGIQTGYSSQISIPSLIFLGIAATCIFTWGYANSGMAYVLRNMQRGDPVFIWTDFMHTVKKNAGQAMLVGVIDVAIIGLLYYDIQTYAYNAAQPLFSFMYIISIFMAVIYFLMRFYIYPMLITFKLSVFKLFKNAFIFVFVGLKRNVLAILGVAATLVLNAFIFIVFMPLGVILPFVLTVAIIGYIGTYAAFPKIKEIMIDPYYSDEGDSEKPEEGDSGQPEAENE